MRRNYSMSRVLYGPNSMVWLVLVNALGYEKEPPALAAGGSRKAARLAQKPHRT